MQRRSCRIVPALGLLAGLALATPSQAGSYLITVTESINVVESNGQANLTSLALSYTGIDGITNATSTASGTYATYPPLTFHTTNPTVTSSASGSTGTIELAYNPSVYSLGGTVTFDTLSSTGNTAGIQLSLVSVVPPPNSSYTVETGPLYFTVTAVPEPSSMALLGIAMTSFVAFRRIFKRSPAA